MTLQCYFVESSPVSTSCTPKVDEEAVNENEDERVEHLHASTRTTTSTRSTKEAAEKLGKVQSRRKIRSKLFDFRREEEEEREKADSSLLNPASILCVALAGHYAAKLFFESDHAWMFL
ncbi:unnamed protein product [Amoebophrya sp. A25]|nr:unnamed protein product [Amoebophrya sp. A25]|eukprot:GSA25T00007151001.1